MTLEPFGRDRERLREADEDVRTLLRKATWGGVEVTNPCRLCRGRGFHAGKLCRCVTGKADGS